MELKADSVIIINGNEYAGDYIIKLLKRREKELEQWRNKSKRQYQRKIEVLTSELQNLKIIPERIPERNSVIIPERNPHQKYNSQYRDDSLDLLPENLRQSVLQREQNKTGIKIPF
jgi:hypothetical protein